MTIVSNVQKKELEKKGPKLTTNGRIVLEKRYLLQNERGEVIETPTQMFKRVANAIAQNEKLFDGNPEEMAKKFYKMMTNLDFLPNSPTLMNAGTKINQLSACFVLPVEDDMDSIFQAIKNAAIIHKSGGGCIAKGTRVFTTFCGVEKIETIFEHYSKFYSSSKVENTEIIDISDRSLRTLSFDKKTGKICTKPITKLWKYKINPNSTIKLTTEGNNTIVTSDWHPFFVWDETNIVEKRADELKRGDYLITPNRSILDDWPYDQLQYIDGFVIDENFAYFIGLFQTDGSLGEFRNKHTGWEGLRLRYFSTDDHLLAAYKSILKELTGHDYTIQTDKRSLIENRVSLKHITCYDRKLTEVVRKINRGVIGKKSKIVRIPELIFKSPISVISAFLAGVLDGDGHVTKTDKKIQFS
ncbi:MAG: ribonucleotide reductase N-terminal alpha domain-containing protein, partial [Candidatus Hodarchaeales archaeon]